LEDPVALQEQFFLHRALAIGAVRSFLKSSKNEDFISNVEIIPSCDEYLKPILQFGIRSSTPTTASEDSSDSYDPK